jgi:hypothetical protein
MTGMPGPTVPQAPSRAGGRITPGPHHRPGNEGDGVHTYQPVVEETSLDHAVPVDSGINAEGDPVRSRQPLAFASGPGSGPVGVDSCAFFAAGGRTRKIRGCLRYVESLTVRGDLARGIPALVADGYHRVCASYYTDQNSDIPLKLADVPR